MTMMLMVAAGGLLAGFLLLWRVQVCPPAEPGEDVSVSVIIPARNEERNLPLLLDSILRSPRRPAEVIVVDDASTDRTAEIAGTRGARVIQSEDLPRGWTGKTWACHQGALAARHDRLLFLDADTRFEPDGFDKVSACFEKLPRDAAFSVLPFHATEKSYEELSIFFHLLMAMGAGLSGKLGESRLFGQSLMTSKEVYERSGGHRAVREHILENFALSSHVYAAGAECFARGGRGTLTMRMFPDGFAQLCEGWGKAFADGAATVQPAILITSVYWLASACFTFLYLLIPSNPWYAWALALYFCFALQLFWFSRQIGSYRASTCLLYPAPLLFYFAVFGRSFYRRLFRRSVVWRGREI